MSQAADPASTLIQSAFEQLMEHIRKQDDLIHSWTRYYLSVQAALAVALSFLIKLGPGGQGVLVNAGSVFIPLTGYRAPIVEEEGQTIPLRRSDFLRAGSGRLDRGRASP